MKIVQIKGANGSGKSTIPLQMLALSEDVKYMEPAHLDIPGGGLVGSHLTILDDLGWVLVGWYHLDAGPTSNGCDKIGKVAWVKQAILDAIVARPTYNVLFEGMMISTIKSTFYNYLLELATSQGDGHIEPLFVILSADVEHCLDRMSQRGTRKSNLKIDNIRTKCDMVIRHARTYDQQYVRWMNVDTIQKEDMLDAFLALVEEEPMIELEYTDDAINKAIHGPEMFSYMDVVKMSRAKVEEYLLHSTWSDDWGFTTDQVKGMNELEVRRALMVRTLGQMAMDRSDIVPEEGIEATMFAPWCVRNTKHPPIFEREVGYKSSSKNEMSLLVMVHQFHRSDVPMLTELEQVESCQDCKGAGGACPGLSPRFTSMWSKYDWMNVITVSMDYAWALEYGSRKNWYMLSGYLDMITVSYINRLTNAVQEIVGKHVLGAHNCPGKCKDCVALRSGKCGRKKRRFSMEAVGIDCDYMHLMMFGEWMPWAYKGLNVSPGYMTRYAAWMSEEQLEPSDARSLILPLMKADKSYTHVTDQYVMDVADKYFDILDEVVVPSGVHKGCRMMAYHFKRLDK